MFSLPERIDAKGEEFDSNPLVPVRLPYGQIGRRRVWGIGSGFQFSLMG